MGSSFSRPETPDRMVTPEVMISQRPAEADDRAVHGAPTNFWEICPAGEANLLILRARVNNWRPRHEPE